jgi:hypothetical protein
MKKQTQKRELNCPRTIEDENKLASARAAADRLTRRDLWNDWLAVGEAFVIGRNEAKRAGNTDQPRGSRYNKAFGQFLADFGLKTIALDGAARKRLFDLMKHREKVEAWRQKLPDDERLAFNHPTTVWRHFKKSCLDQEQSSPQGRQSPFVALKQSLVESQEEVSALKTDLEREKQKVAELQSNNASLMPGDDPSRIMEFLTSTYPEPTLKGLSELLIAFLTSTFPDPALKQNDEFVAKQLEAGSTEKRSKTKRASK